MATVGEVRGEMYEGNKGYRLRVLPRAQGDAELYEALKRAATPEWRESIGATLVGFFNDLRARVDAPAGENTVQHADDAHAHYTRAAGGGELSGADIAAVLGGTLQESARATNLAAESDALRHDMIERIGKAERQIMEAIAAGLGDIAAGAAVAHTVAVDLREQTQRTLSAGEAYIAEVE